MRTHKKTDYPCFLRKSRTREDPISFFRRIGRNAKYSIQRIRYGYCDMDTWDIDDWFLHVIPHMLSDLKKNTHGYPAELTEEKWDVILSEMIHLFLEAREGTCSQKNEYENQWMENWKKFQKQYGSMGEKLDTEKQKEDRTQKGLATMHFPSEVPAYKDISKKYLDREKEIESYRDECKNKAFEMFSKYFWNLWD